MSRQVSKSWAMNLSKCCAMRASADQAQAVPARCCKEEVSPAVANGKSLEVDPLGIRLPLVRSPDVVRKCRHVVSSERLAGHEEVAMLELRTRCMRASLREQKVAESPCRPL